MVVAIVKIGENQNDEVSKPIDCVWRKVAARVRKGKGEAEQYVLKLKLVDVTYKYLINGTKLVWNKQKYQTVRSILSFQFQHNFFSVRLDYFIGLPLETFPFDFDVQLRQKLWPI